MNNLYIRDDTKKKLKADIHCGFSLHSSPSSYRDAVLLGQDVAGYGNFYGYTGEGVCPSREDQLLLESKKRSARRNHKLEAALLLD